MKRPQEINRGNCRCIREPRCEGGLEGFNQGETYHFQEMKNWKGRYFRVWLSENYYETCGPGLFMKFFEVTNK